MKKLVSKLPEQVNLLEAKLANHAHYVAFSVTKVDTGEIENTGILARRDFEHGPFRALSSRKISQGNTYPAIAGLETMETVISSSEEENKHATRLMHFFVFDSAKEMYHWLWENTPAA